MENNTMTIVSSYTKVHETIKNGVPTEQKVHSQQIISGLRKDIIEFLIRIETIFLVVRYIRNPVVCFKVFRAMDPHRRNIMGDRKIKKIVKVNGKYFWGLFIPSWPSTTFHNFLKTEINRFHPIPVRTNRFTNIFIAVTNKCPLACEHCYEWDALNKKEKLSLPELKEIIQKFQEKGISQFHITGGEPLVRINDICTLLKTTKKDSEFWIATSGFNMTAENAHRLKTAGLTGVMISLDHFEPDMHDMFRGYKESYQWVEWAVKNSIDANLVTALSLCVTKSFVDADNLMRYYTLAKNLGVSFIQILEPRAVGHYRGRDVDLNHDQEKIVEAFYLKANYDEQYLDYPLVCYHGYHQRRMGCLAAGKRSLYVDTIGDIHACPFCQAKTGNALDDDMDHAIELLQSAGCHKF